MNKQMKQHLEAIVDALVEQDSAAAKEAFHEYLRLKSQAILMSESIESEEKSDDDKDDDEDDDEDKEHKKDEKNKEEEEDCDM